MPVSVEIYPVGHERGNTVCEHWYTLTVTDIATGAAENRAVPDTARKWVDTAIEKIASTAVPTTRDRLGQRQRVHRSPFARLIERRHISLTRSEPGSFNDGAHTEQKNRAVCAPSSAPAVQRLVQSLGHRTDHPRHCQDDTTQEDRRHAGHSR
nr:integrase, catalytic region domain protein [Rhodococcus sp. JVH1]